MTVDGDSILAPLAMLSEQGWQCHRQCHRARHNRQLRAPGLNLKRRHLTKSQAACVGLNIEPLLAREARKRQKATQLAGKNADGTPKRTSVPPKSAEPNRSQAGIARVRKKGETRELAAAIVGVGRQYVSEAKAVKKAALETTFFFRQATTTYANLHQQKRTGADHPTGAPDAGSAPDSPRHRT